MPLFLRALPLSFKTFWRYLILLPFLAMGAIILSLVTAFIPFANYFVPGTISAFFVIVGLRCALAARGHHNLPDLRQLLFYSLVFCIINIVATNVLGLAFGLILSVTALTLSATGVAADSPTMLTTLFSMLGGMLFLKLVFIALYASAMAVPMTAAGFAATERGRDQGIFFGFGKGLFSLTLVMLVWLYVGRIFAIFGEVWTMFALIVGALYAAISGNEIPWDWSFDRATLMGGTLWMTWASSWFYATAVLAWEKAGLRQQQLRAEAIEANRVSPEDLRALRASRQQRQGLSTGD